MTYLDGRAEPRAALAGRSSPIYSDARPEERPSNRDQTLSDTDQTLSDSDQQASDAGLRDETARPRDAVAQERDALAAERDGDAHIRDEKAGRLDQSDELLDKLPVQELRSRASMARGRAANDRTRARRDDRTRARRDRERAARDRKLAARDREQAARERRKAGTDELTGARRRGVGLEELDREIERARRTGGNLVAVYVDVDNLKTVNDGLGHRAGDELLCSVVDGLKRHVRTYDLVMRLGGDEFLCALPDATLDDAHGRFDDLNADLHEGSVSVGFAALRDGENSENLVDRADRDLLAARGR